jgi:hypothetical protein
MLKKITVGEALRRALQAVRAEYDGSFEDDEKSNHSWSATLSSREIENSILEALKREFSH